MRETAIYLNGVWPNFLEEITQVQRKRPTQTLFLQPTGDRPITYLRRGVASIEDPVILYASPTNDRAHVHYAAEIVDWSDKYKLSGKHRERVERIIDTFQKEEKYGVFEGSLNLIHVRNMRRFKQPFPISNLVKISNNEPLKQPPRAGGFSYVRPLADAPPFADF